MKRLLMVAIACIVVDQLKSEYGWITKCKGIEVDGEVVFDKEIRRGLCVNYRPFILPADEVIHGQLMAEPCVPPTERQQTREPSDTGKTPT